MSKIPSIHEMINVTPSVNADLPPLPLIEFENEESMHSLIGETGMFVVRSLVQAHADAGVDIQAPAYLRGLQTIMETIAARGDTN